jgi:hypothetical protein
MTDRAHRNFAAGLCIAGWLVGLPIYMFAGSGAESLPYELTYDNKVNIDRLERLGGKSAFFYQQLGEFLSSFFRGSTLGLTIGVLATLLALAWYAMMLGWSKRS